MHGEFKICVAVVVLCTSRKNTRQNGSLYRNFGYVFRYWFCRATKVGSSIDIFLSSLIFCVVQKMSRKVICQNSKKWVSSGSHFGNVGVIRNCPPGNWQIGRATDRANVRERKGAGWLETVK
jgi:hypothetical protein